MSISSCFTCTNMAYSTVVGKQLSTFIKFKTHQQSENFISIIQCGICTCDNVAPEIIANNKYTEDSAVLFLKVWRFYLILH